MKREVERVINLTKFLGFELSWLHIFSLFLYPSFISLLFGFINKNIIASLLNSLILFSLPGIFLALFGKLVFRKAKLKHLFLASGLGVVIYSTFFFLSFYISYFLNITFGYSSIIIAGLLSSLIWYGLGVLFFKQTWRALFFSLIQFITYTTVFSLVLYIDFFTFNYKFILASIPFLLAIGFTIYLINLPIKKRFGISGLDALSMFLAQWFYSKKDLEETLTTLSKPFEGEIEVIKLKGKKEAILVIPPIHYGPFGDLGSSNFPSVLKKQIPKATALHSPSTHNQNLVNSKEEEKIIKKIKTNRDYLEEEGFSYTEVKKGKAKAHLLLFGKTAVVFLSRYPYTTEDINYSLGCYLKEILKHRFRDVFIVDLHNSEGKDITYFSLLSKEGKEYVDVVRELLNKKLTYSPLYFSYSHIKKEEINNPSLGGAGISIFAFKWKKPVVLIVIDGNAIKRECKERIEKELSKLTPYVLIATTDSHEVNLVRGVVNEFSCSKKEVDLIVKEVEKAISNLERAKAYVAKIPVKLKILGENFYEDVVTTLSNSLSLAKVLFPIAILLALVISIYLINLI